MQRRYCFLICSLLCCITVFNANAQGGQIDAERAKAKYDSEHNQLIRQVGGAPVPERPHAVIVHHIPSVADRKANSEKLKIAIQQSRENLEKLNAPKEELHRKKLIGRIIYYSIIGLFALFIYLRRRRKNTKKIN